MEFTRQAFLVQVSTWRLHRLGPSVVSLVLSQFLAGQWRPAAHRTAGTSMLGGAVADGLKGLDQPTSPPVGTKDIRAAGPKSLLSFHLACRLWDLSATG
jgi:hypothetical protein